MNSVITLFAGIIMISAFIFFAFLSKSKPSKYKVGKINRFYTVPVLMMILAIVSIFPGCKENNIPIQIKKKYVWAVGETDSTNHGTILFSNDGGTTWTQQGTNCAALLGISLSDVWAVDENTAWVVGNKDLILKTTDGGLDWTQITPPNYNINTNLKSISIVGKNDVWISTSDGQVLHSLDGGSHWTDLKSSVLGNHYLQGIDAINNNVIYVVANNPGFIARTTDGGQTWDSIVPSPSLKNHGCIGVAATDINHVVVYGGAAYYMMTTDGGQSWTYDSIPNTGGGATGGADINCMKMLDSQTWWGALDMDNIFITESAGSNWVKQPSSTQKGNMFLVGIDYYDKDLCVVVGISTGMPPINGGIFRTTDGGQTWKLVKKTYAGLWKVSFIK